MNEHDDSRWKILHTAVAQLARHKCKDCEGPGCLAHHEFYVKDLTRPNGLRPCWEYKPEQLVWLCESCHARRHLRAIPVMHGEGEFEAKMQPAWFLPPITNPEVRRKPREETRITKRHPQQFPLQLGAKDQADKAIQTAKRFDQKGEKKARYHLRCLAGYMEQLKGSKLYAGDGENAITVIQSHYLALAQLPLEKMEQSLLHASQQYEQQAQMLKAWPSNAAPICADAARTMRDTSLEVRQWLNGNINYEAPW